MWTNRTLPRVPALMNNLGENAAARPVRGLLYISLGKNGRKRIMDKFPQINNVLIQRPHFRQF